MTLHLCGWALLVSLPIGFLSLAIVNKGDRHLPTPGFGPGPGGSMPFDPSWIRIETLITHGLLAIFFYTNLLVLVPRVLKKNGWKAYLLLVIFSFLLYLAFGYWFRINVLPMDESFKPPFFIGVPNFFMVFGLSLALRIIQDRAVFENSMKERENERLKSELSFLRSQVSPHFVFNVLNSLASLARKKSDQLESIIIHLSQLMRYALYHTHEKVSLEQEANYITNYINLQKLRFGNCVSVSFQVDIEKTDLLIEPMLLIPFVENAFKHGVGMIQDPLIRIILEESADQVDFIVRNKFNPMQNETKDSSSGMGLQNIKRRLDLLYPDMYSVKTYITDDHWFVAELKLIVE